MFLLLYRLMLVPLLMGCGVAVAEAERMAHGREIFEEHCAQCHDGEAADAPGINNSQDWKGRSELWEAVLFEHAKKGYLQMPAGGGQGKLSEYDVGAAAEYMLTSSHPDLPAD